LNASGVGTFTFTKAVNGTAYWLDVTHRSAVETYSAATVTFTANALSYDFTTGTNKAYGDNMKQVGSKFVFFGGDVNQDGIVDSGDLGLIDTDYGNFVAGYVNTDVNGDGITDSSDMGITDTNYGNFVGKIVPPGAPGAQHNAIKTVKAGQKLKVNNTNQ
jgi:hypothetical protein